jgi:hypothetical protein
MQKSGRGGADAHAGGGGGRRKPMSGKQKREMLKEQRAKDKGKRTRLPLTAPRDGH